jgi:hypothetical protein
MGGTWRKSIPFVRAALIGIFVAGVLAGLAIWMSQT